MDWILLDLLELDTRINVWDMDGFGYIMDTGIIWIVCIL